MSNHFFTDINTRCLGMGIKRLSPYFSLDFWQPHLSIYISQEKKYTLRPFRRSSKILLTIRLLILVNFPLKTMPHAFIPSLYLLLCIAGNEENSLYFFLIKSKHSMEKFCTLFPKDICFGPYPLSVKCF